MKHKQSEGDNLEVIWSFANIILNKNFEVKRVEMNCQRSYSDLLISPNTSSSFLYLELLAVTPKILIKHIYYLVNTYLYPINRMIKNWGIACQSLL